MRPEMRRSVALVLLNVATMIEDRGNHDGLTDKGRRTVRSYRDTARALSVGRKPTKREMRGIGPDLRGKIVALCEAQEAV